LLLEACFHPDSLIPNGNINVIQSKIYQPGDSLKINCDNGFTPSSNLITCTQTMNWYPIPTCSLGKCTVPHSENGYFTTINSKNDTLNTLNNTARALVEMTINQTTTTFDFNTSIQLVCKDGYEANGQTLLTCQPDETWGHTTATCVKVVCNDTSDVRQDAVDTYPQLRVGETGNAAYNSKYFHLTNGRLELRCLKTRKLEWIDPPALGDYFYISLSVYAVHCITLILRNADKQLPKLSMHNKNLIYTFRFEHLNDLYRTKDCVKAKHHCLLNLN